MLYNKSNNKSNFRLHSLKKTNKQAFKQNQKKKKKSQKLLRPKNSLFLQQSIGIMKYFTC